MDQGQESTVDWPFDLARLIIAEVPRSHHPDLRLVNTVFRACIDPSITSLQASTSKAWKTPPLCPSQLVNVERINVKELEFRADHWETLQRMARNLPKLTHIMVHSRMGEAKVLPTSAASLSCLTRLDLPGAVLNINLPADVQLPMLKAASFGVVLGTAQLAGLAPNLEQLCCEHLQVATFGNNRPMPSVTHFGGSRVFQRASNSREAATLAAAAAAVGPAGAAAAVAAAARQQLVAAFPNLRVLFKLPQGVSYNDYDGLSALAPSTSLQAIRGIGRFRSTHIWQQLQQQQHLQRLSLHDEWGISGFQGVSQLTQLWQLRLTGTCSGENASLVLQQITMLPQLQVLELPAELLCRSCCPDAGSSWAGIASMHSLRQLLFLQLQPLFDCPHSDSRQHGLQQIRMAAAAARQTADQGQALTQQHLTAQQQQQQQQEQQQQQQQHQKLLLVEELIEQRTLHESPWKQDSCIDHSAWGVYG